MGNRNIELETINKRPQETLDKIRRLEKQLEQAETENERVRQANLDVMMHFEDMKAAKEQAEARCAELESENESLWETFVKVSDYLGIDSEAARKIPGKPSQVFISAIIRKQAEAVEQAALCFGGRDFADVRLGLSEQAQQLRQQADELEKGGEGCQ